MVPMRHRYIISGLAIASVDGAQRLGTLYSKCIAAVFDLKFRDCWSIDRRGRIVIIAKVVIICDVALNTFSGVFCGPLKG